MRITIPVALILAAASAACGQDAAPDKATLQQKLADLKASVAANKAKLAKYQWLQTTQVAIKGETKKQENFQCKYGPDGKVQKTLVGPPPEPKAPPGGLKGKIVAKKVEEMKDYTDRLQSLISHYAPPDPARLQASAKAGKASLAPGEGTATLIFADYYKPGDKVTFSYDTAAKRLLAYNVDTYLDDPKKDVVTLNNHFATLDDGTNYLQQTVLDATGKEIKITTTNQGHSLIPK